MVVPAVAISTVLGALNGYVLTKWRFRGDTWVFGLLLFGCFIPFQMVLIPMARLLGLMGIAGTVPGLIFVHLVYGIGFSTLYFKNYYQQFPTELVRAAMIDGAGFFTIFRRIMLPSLGADRGGLHHLAVHQHLERLPVRRLVLRLRQPADDGGAQQPRPVLDRA